MGFSLKDRLIMVCISFPLVILGACSSYTTVSTAGGEVTLSDSEMQQCEAANKYSNGVDACLMISRKIYPKSTKGAVKSAEMACANWKLAWYPISNISDTRVSISKSCTDLWRLNNDAAPNLSSSQKALAEETADQYMDFVEKNTKNFNDSELQYSTSGSAEAYKIQAKNKSQSPQASQITCYLSGLFQACSAAERAGLVIPSYNALSKLNQLREQYWQTQLSDAAKQMQEDAASDARHSDMIWGAVLGGLQGATATMQQTAVPIQQSGNIYTPQISSKAIADSMMTTSKSFAYGSNIKENSPKQLPDGTDAKACVKLEFHSRGEGISLVGAKNICSYAIKVKVCYSDGSECHNDGLNPGQGGATFDFAPSGRKYVFAACRDADTWTIVEPGQNEGHSKPWQGLGEYRCLGHAN